MFGSISHAHVRHGGARYIGTTIVLAEKPPNTYGAAGDSRSLRYRSGAFSASTAGGTVGVGRIARLNSLN